MTKVPLEIGATGTARNRRRLGWRALLGIIGTQVCIPEVFETSIQ